ncbi:hypothetical protein [Natronococcus wangiae]|uniref:hypothetical protein n=1 Tax=Natronococcus wangiae TaxID=3068275 RepID=UPI00273DDC78|nr:hypothetical protein [Natronococcus sp. AD5]
MAEWAEEYVADASKRKFFSDGITDIFEDHKRGANNLSLIAQITTVEHWLQTNID